jgi:hypothetical protein
MHYKQIRNCSHPMKGCSTRLRVDRNYNASVSKRGALPSFPRFKLMATVGCCGLVFLLGCAEPNAPIRSNGLAQRVGQHYCPSHWTAIGFSAVAAIISPGIFWRRRLGYAAAICSFMGVLCAAAWIEGRHSGGHVAVRSHMLASHTMDESMVSISWGRGGLSVQRRVWRTNNLKIISQRQLDQNPMLQWVRADNSIYPFGGGPDVRSSPRPFPLTWGFQFSSNREASGFKDPKTAPLIWAITVPVWFLLVLLSIPPAFWLRRTVRQIRRRRRGLCPQCGYDIRASADICPECGSPIATRTKTPPPASDTGAREDKQPPTEEPTSPPSS